ncbi:hypothetical protein T4E_8885 [Trichinella pseudospiralis]|uniref:Uncharacterized protein n=1 Tax=Trichinella pseudospiralis TaxID=6337 RepID=A0A0V0XXT1_TRIPS|nr:hypothetical protein T4E_8885 [Trichinella pseudospiralis]
MAIKANAFMWEDCFCIEALSKLVAISALNKPTTISDELLLKGSVSHSIIVNRLSLFPIQIACIDFIACKWKLWSERLLVCLRRRHVVALHFKTANYERVPFSVGSPAQHRMFMG